MSHQAIVERDNSGHCYSYVMAGDIKMAPFPVVRDYAKRLSYVRNVKLRHDDVIIVGYPKSGNNWIRHIVAMLIGQKVGHNESKSPDNSYYCIDYAGDDVLLPEPTSPRAVFSHFPFSYLPDDVTNKMVKLVYVTRNPKDVLVSLYHHLGKMTHPHGYHGPWADFLNFMLDNGYLYGDMFEHLLNWETVIEQRPELPIFQCNYEETIRDVSGQIQRLNIFLRGKRSIADCEAIANFCTVENMRRELQLNVAPESLLLEGTSVDEALFRKGVVGEWKDWFTVAQNEHFDLMYMSKMKSYKRTFMYE